MAGRPGRWLDNHPHRALSCRMAIFRIAVPDSASDINRSSATAVRQTAPGRAAGKSQAPIGEFAFYSCIDEFDHVGLSDLFIHADDVFFDCDDGAQFFLWLFQWRELTCYDG